jgi:hypothetical protein
MRENFMSKQHLWRQILKSLMVGGLVATSIQPVTAETTCYAVADNDTKPGSKDVLVKMSPDGTTETIGTTIGTQHMEAIVFDPKGEVLYAFNSQDPVDVIGNVGGPGQFGTLDLATGEFKVINGQSFGSANGELGIVDINDVDGLTFDYAVEGTMYGTGRTHEDGAYDLLIQINPYTGELVRGAFGGKDYVVIKIEGAADYDNVDDIASDPQDGTLYIIANTGNGKEGALAVLERNASGVPTGKAIMRGNNDVDDIESLDFEKIPKPDGSFRLYGTTGYKAGGNSNQLYELNKDTGHAGLLGRLLPVQGNAQEDIEAVSCQPEPRNCLMYAVHDEGQYDSQLIVIDPWAGHGVGSVKPLGPMYPARDLEGLAIIDVNGKFYGTSGGDMECEKVQATDSKGNLLWRDPPTNSIARMTCKKDAKGNPVPLMPNGGLYEIDRETGAIKLVGLTGFYEVSGLAYNPDTDTVWGWASGGVEGKPAGSAAGPITIDLETGKGTLVKAFPYLNPIIQASAFSSDGKKLYGVVVNRSEKPYGTDIWEYDVDSQELVLKCKMAIAAEAEALEMQPNGSLLMAVNNNADVGIIAYDPEKCETVATRTFKKLSAYYDLESIEWPAKECQYRSWLSAGSGDMEIMSIEYQMVPDDVSEAVRLALGNAEDITVENEHGKVTVYIGNQRFVVRPAIYGTKSGERAARSRNCPVTQATVSADFSVLTFTDCQGNTQTWNLNPEPVYADALVNALNQYGQGQVNADGTVSITLTDGTVITGKLGIQVTPAQVAPGASIQPDATDLAELTPLADMDGNGLVDYEVKYPAGQTQMLFITSVR